MLNNLLTQTSFLAFISVIISFGLVHYIIPKIIFMVNHHNLNEIPLEIFKLKELQYLFLNDNN